jgi:very-short-patch-repair endonuclease
MREHDPRRKHFETFYARQMRSNPTVAERKLWQALRRKTFGVRFRRQQPIGSFIVDFYCSPARLVIELDGTQHGTDDQVAYDDERTRWLQQKGYRVLRFWNDEVLYYQEGVLERIQIAMAERGVPPPKA